MQSCNQCHKIITIVNYDQAKMNNLAQKMIYSFFTLNVNIKMLKMRKVEACLLSRSSSLASPLEVTKIVRTTATNGVTLWCVAQVWLRCSTNRSLSSKWRPWRCVYTCDFVMRFYIAICTGGTLKTHSTLMHFCLPLHDNRLRKTHFKIWRVNEP